MAEIYDWLIDENGFLTNVNFIDIPEKSMKPPFPSSLWRIEGGRTTHELLDEMPEKSMKKPYPKALWRIENGSPTHELLPESMFRGAFENAGKLRKIVIPETVKKIGKRSFSGTALKTVKIPQDCEYSESSFPEGCKIEFYE